MNIHFIFHLAKTWLSERSSSSETDFIFKEESFQFSMHYLYLTNNIYKDKISKKLKITPTCFGSYVIHHQQLQSCA